MVRGLLILNSAYSGSRDLWFPLVPKATKGYNVYRAFDAPFNWVKLNKDGPVPGHFFRDSTRLRLVKYPIQTTDWIDQNGVTGPRIFKIPEMPASKVENGKVKYLSAPEDVLIEVSYQNGTKQVVRSGMVSAIDQTVTLPIGEAVQGAAAPEAGSVAAWPIINYEQVESFTAIFHTVENYVDIAANLIRTYYTVVPVGDHGEFHAPGAPGTEVVNSIEVDRMDYMQHEMVRRNQWIFEQVAEPTYLMYRKRAGELCGCTTTETGTPRTRCPICFEVGYVGGYYGPYDMQFIDPDSPAVRTLDEGGIKVERPSKSFLGPTPIVQDGDMIIRRNGERLVISNVTYKMPRGVLLQQDFDVELLPPGDTRYLIPIASPEEPVIYNPAVTGDPLDGKGGAEPIYEATTVPGKHWENPDPQVGRSITFGRIQS